LQSVRQICAGNARDKRAAHRYLGLVADRVPVPAADHLVRLVHLAGEATRIRVLTLRPDRELGKTTARRTADLEYMSSGKDARSWRASGSRRSGPDVVDRNRRSS